MSSFPDFKITSNDVNGEKGSVMVYLFKKQSLRSGHCVRSNNRNPKMSEAIPLLFPGGSCVCVQENPSSLNMVWSVFWNKYYEIHIALIPEMFQAADDRLSWTYTVIKDW